LSTELWNKINKTLQKTGVQYQTCPSSMCSHRKTMEKYHSGMEKHSELPLRMLWVFHFF